MVDDKICFGVGKGHAVTLSRNSMGPLQHTAATTTLLIRQHLQPGLLIFDEADAMDIEDIQKLDPDSEEAKVLEAQTL
jgi:hypothetical protein